MTRQRLKAILQEHKDNPDLFFADGGHYFLEFLPAIEGYFSYAEAIARKAAVEAPKPKAPEVKAAPRRLAKKKWR